MVYIRIIDKIQDLKKNILCKLKVVFEYFDRLQEKRDNIIILSAISGVLDLCMTVLVGTGILTITVIILLGSNYVYFLEYM